MNHSASEVSQFGTSSHEVESPRLFLQGDILWDKKGWRIKTKMEGGGRSYPTWRRQSIKNIQKMSCCSTGRTVSLCASVVWEKYRRSSSLRPSVMCNILKITIRGWDTTWVTTMRWETLTSFVTVLQLSDVSDKLFTDIEEKKHWALRVTAVHW